MTTAMDVQQQPQASAAKSPALRRFAFGFLFAGLLLIGLVQLGVLFADDEPTPILQMRERQLVPSGMLLHALRQPELPATWRGPAVGPTFRNADGAECRRFAGRATEEGPISGIACVGGGEWRVVDLHQDVAPPKLR